ncbi:MAG: hypothetical protein K0Q49_1801 [Haloplasmataceae bacterium]|jgi:hypothetical protein|nr:hypothetical protein [Haloplasmataceae bacterium]
MNNQTLNGLDEGDRIRVISAGGLNDTGRFIRVQDNFLIWVRDDGATPDLTITSLFGISVSKL